MAIEEGLLTTLEDLVKPQHSALVVVDMQNDGCHKDGFFGKGGYDARGHGQKPADLSLVEEMVPNLIHLVDVARAGGIKMYFVQHSQDDYNLPPMERLRKLRIGRTRVLCPEGEWGGEFFEGFQPKPGETVIQKHVNSAFICTNFKEILENAGIRTIIVTGTATNVCCEATVQDGSALGFYVVVPQDCVATFSREEQERSLARIDTMWGVVTTSQEIIGTWKK